MVDNPILSGLYVALTVLGVLAPLVTAIAMVRIAVELRRWRLSTPMRLEGELRMLTRFVGIVAIAVTVLAASSIAQLLHRFLVVT